MSFSALILAGGQSRRMGQDKAELRLGKLSLLQHMQQLAQQAGASQILLSRNQPGTTYIQDLRPGQGPLAGIAAALRYCTEPVLLVLPIDLPLLSAGSLQLLVPGDNEQAVCFRDWPLPLALRPDPKLAHLIEQQLDAGERSVKALLAKLRCTVRPAPDVELFNTNTPAEWQQCLSTLQQAAILEEPRHD